MWKRFLNGILNFIMVVSGIVVVFWALIALADGEFLTGLLILLVGAFVILLTCSGLGILVEIAYHLEAIERNIGGYQGESSTSYNSSSNTSTNSYTGERRVHPLLSGAYSQENKRVHPLLANSSTSNNKRFGGSWECGKCGCDNSAKALFCEKCGNKK